MTYLLDVNALVALGFENHEFHDRVALWLRAQQFPQLATCSITELGFLRVLAQASAYEFTVPQAPALLLRMKHTEPSRFTFLKDDHDVSHLPAWVKTPKQTTDGHLAKLASANGAVVATLDGKIPGAYRRGYSICRDLNPRFSVYLVAFASQSLALLHAEERR